MRLLPSLTNVSLGPSSISTWMSPLIPLRRPVFPLPGTLTTIPCATPAGMLISTTSSPLTTPVPPHSLHLFLITLPSPPQVGHTPCVCIIPKMLCVVWVIYPEPWQVWHVSIPLPASAPLPPQC